MFVNLKPAGLNGLKSDDQLQLLDTIDSLRSQGIHHYVSLPQIIVCGDQSSGKSSVLEAISGVSFPIKSTICTRFPTELVLRKSVHEGIEVRIIPHQSRTGSEKESLAKFNRKLDDFSNLPELIEAARASMAMLTPGMSFSRDILRVEIYGPDRPHLTMVDLPGLIHSETKTQSAEDVSLIKEVVRSYMQEPRTIILAVVSAKYEYSNQIILRLAREADPKGHRTMGVITKPDTLLEGSQSEKKFITLAKNQDIEFRLGWHILRNADSEKGPITLEQRDSKEAYFFSSGLWVELPSFVRGIVSLRTRLSQLLFYQIVAELPELVAEIRTKADDCRAQLEKMGSPRQNLEHQKLYLVQVSQRFQALVKAADQGAYHDSFFHDPMSKPGYTKRLRATVQKLNEEFSIEMRTRGRSYTVSSSCSRTPNSLTHKELIDKVVRLAERTRGRELPGLWNPMMIAELFRELSSPWEAIAKKHVDRTWEASAEFMEQVAKATADSVTADSLKDVILDPKLDEIRLSLYGNLKKVVQPHQEGHPITYSEGLRETLHQVQMKRVDSAITTTIKSFLGEVTTEGQTIRVSKNVNTGALRDELLKAIDPCSNRHEAMVIIDHVDHYYETALQRFIDIVAVDVIETSLVAELSKVFDPTAVAMMTNQQISLIADETEQRRMIREELQQQLHSLEEGNRIFHKYQKAVFAMMPAMGGNENYTPESGSILEGEEAPEPTSEAGQRLSENPLIPDEIPVIEESPVVEESKEAEEVPAAEEFPAAEEVPAAKEAPDVEEIAAEEEKPPSEDIAPMPEFDDEPSPFWSRKRGKNGKLIWE
ncbi:unnamed protein product [Clonostachys rosea]|uniref:GED domain-containing protein n=1 Tax=Bionectria ochroleuca TaxID=29856 RepID=A0ABY6UUC7_BIOOC|nr:unnamed protein product [Clonostachys rosea]